MSVATAGKIADDPRAAGTSSVGGVIVLTLITLTAYFYFYLYRSLGRFETEARSDEERAAARRTRNFVTAGLVLQFLAVLSLLAGIAPLLTDPGHYQAFWTGLEQMRLNLPTELTRADTASELINWAGWVVFWAPIFLFFSAALRAEGEPAGVAGIANVLVGFRILVGLCALVGLDGVAHAMSSFDPILYLVLVGCVVASANAVWIARAARA